MVKITSRSDGTEKNTLVCPGKFYLFFFFHSCLLAGTLWKQPETLSPYCLFIRLIIIWSACNVSTFICRRRRRHAHQDQLRALPLVSYAV